MALRCHDTCTSPATGESTIWPASPFTGAAPPAPPLPPPPPPPRAPPPGISSITSSNWRTASPLKPGSTARIRGRRAPPGAAPCRAGRPAVGPGWRTRPARRLRAAERLELVGQRLPLVAPRPLLLALLGDHLGGRPRDEILVRELRREPGELLVEPAQIAREAAALLLHVDLALERHEHVAAVGEHGVRAHAGVRAVEGELGELSEPQDRLPLSRQRATHRLALRLHRCLEPRLRGHAVLGTQHPDRRDRFLHQRELVIRRGVHERGARRRPRRHHERSEEHTSELQ